MNISVCLCTYNGARYLQGQLASVLCQLGSEDEVILVDDVSTDDTVAVAESFADRRIKIFRNVERLGIVRNFERALMESRGELLFLCDQDDLWLPKKVAIVRAALQECDLVISDATLVDATGEETAGSFFALHNSGPGLLRNVVRNSYIGCCMAFRRKLLDVALPFPKGVPMHDVWLGCVAEMLGSTRFVGQALVHYRRHGQNASQTAQVSSHSWLRKLGFRVALVRALFVRCLFAIKASRLRR
ncbi:MAG: glycosyltransferase family 2 protein [Accumulibacter sp.]|jgi:glycosyltransferase involved in cell wall biosynthesis|uniref:glycosyltransferase family 2 protein n=1 Tax=Accumulibacter sp. TaxID=2053492 RepID=UPI001ACDFD38|nr:glycosyltransferase family 2 protein [Candidatus Accumulibacter necessarius]